MADFEFRQEFDFDQRDLEKPPHHLPCAAIAVLWGDFILTSGSRPSEFTPTAMRAKMEKAYTIYTDLLALPELKAQLQGETCLLAVDIIMHTTRTRPVVYNAWTLLAEATGLHYVDGSVTQAQLDFMRDISSVSTDKSRNVPLYACSLQDAVYRLDALSCEQQRPLASVIAYQGHTIAVVAFYVNDTMSLYYAVDSLPGRMLVSANKLHFCFELLSDWLRPYDGPVSTQPDADTTRTGVYQCVGNGAYTMSIYYITPVPNLPPPRDPSPPPPAVARKAARTARSVATPKSAVDGRSDE